MEQQLLPPNLNFQFLPVDLAAGEVTEIGLTASYFRIKDANRDFEISFDGSRYMPVALGMHFKMPTDPASGIDFVFKRLFIRNPAAAALSAEIYAGFGPIGDDSAVLQVTGTVPNRIEEIEPGLVAAGNQLPMHLSDIDPGLVADGNLVPAHIGAIDPGLVAAANSLPVQQRASFVLHYFDITLNAGQRSLFNGSSQNVRSNLIENRGVLPVFVGVGSGVGTGCLLEPGEKLSVDWASTLYAENASSSFGPALVRVFRGRTS